VRSAEGRSISHQPERSEAGRDDPGDPGQATGSEAELGPVALSRLLDEIRADARWREELAALREGAEAPATAQPSAEAIASALDELDDAIEAADAVVPIEPGRLVIGDAWGRVRRQIHAEIRIYQDRQTEANRRVAAALRRIAAQLDRSAEGATIGELWRALGQLEARVAATESLGAEIEPLGAMRVALQEIEARLREVERWRASG
jgi:hypothetical protein